MSSSTKTSSNLLPLGTWTALNSLRQKTEHGAAEIIARGAGESAERTRRSHERAWWLRT